MKIQLFHILYYCYKIIQTKIQTNKTNKQTNKKQKQNKTKQKNYINFLTYFSFFLKWHYLP